MFLMCMTWRDRRLRKPPLFNIIYIFFIRFKVVKVILWDWHMIYFCLLILLILYGRRNSFFLSSSSPM